MASFSVANNLMASNAQANLGATNIKLQSAIARLSSGFRINHSGDDPVGLAQANTYRSEQAILGQGIRNANDGLSNLQIKDSALDNISKILDRMATLATQGASSSSTVNRADLDAEFQALEAELNREAAVAGVDSSTTFSVFVDEGSNGTISGTIGDVDSTALALNTSTLSTAAAASTALTAVVAAVATLATVQSNVGILQNRLQYAVSLGGSQVVNNQAAESRIRDANMAEEAANMARYNILTQSGMAALAQANNIPAAVLALLN